MEIMCQLNDSVILNIIQNKVILLKNDENNKSYLKLFIPLCNTIVYYKVYKIELHC